MNGSTKKRIDRPTVDAVPLTVRVPPAQLTALDAWRAVQDDNPSRPEAMRRLSFPKLDELPLQPWQRDFEDLAKRLPKGPVRERSAHAFHCLRQAWKLRHIDAPMAALRAITAEEEASSALIQAVTLRKYPGAENLNYKSHNHKCAIWPLILAVHDVFVQSSAIDIIKTVNYRKKGKAEIQILFDLSGVFGLEEPMLVSPNPPLHFSIRADGEIHNFLDELLKLAVKHGAPSAKKHIEDLANARNKILYATEKGSAKVEIPDAWFPEMAQRLGIICGITVMVMQSYEKQLFVVQCIDSMLNLLERIPSLPFDYSEADLSKLEGREFALGRGFIKLRPRK